MKKGIHLLRGKNLKEQHNAVIRLFLTYKIVRHFSIEFWEWINGKNTYELELWGKLIMTMIPVINVIIIFGMPIIVLFLLFFKFYDLKRKNH